MQNRFAHAKRALFRDSGRALADVGIIGREDLALIGKPDKDRWSAFVRRRSFTGAPFPSSPKSNSGLKSSPSFTVALKRPSHFAAESFQRPDPPSVSKLLHFPALE